MKRKISSQTFLRFSMVFVLVGSLRHVAWGFSTLENSGTWSLFWGYFQAVAIDLVVIALAYGIEQRKRSSLPTGWYWVGIVGFVLVSTYANLLYGLVFSIDVEQSKDWPRLSLWMVYLKPFVLSGVLPIMLVYISHITAGNQAGTVAANRPQLKAAWVKSIIDSWQNLQRRQPSPIELAKTYTQESGQMMTSQEAAGFLASVPIGQSVELRESGQPVQIIGQSEPVDLTDQDVEHKTVKFYRDELKLSWNQIAEKMNRSKTTVIKYYQSQTPPVDVPMSTGGTNGKH